MSTLVFLLLLSIYLSNSSVVLINFESNQLNKLIHRFIRFKLQQQQETIASSKSSDKLFKSFLPEPGIIIITLLNL